MTTSRPEITGITAELPGRIAKQAPVIVVIGDVMLDEWWTGSIERMCREAPAPVVDISRREQSPGGAANTAMNLAALGARVRLVGLVGADPAGERLRELVDGAGIDTTGLLVSEAVRTTTKCRLVAGDQVIARIDESDDRRLPAELLDRLAGAAILASSDASAEVICDYGSGALQSAVRDALAARSARPEISVVDAHDLRIWKQLRPDFVTPNAQEAAAVLGISLDGQDRVEQVVARGEDLLALSGAKAAAVTLDRLGSVLVSSGENGYRTYARPATEKQASGAGDTFVAGLTLALASGEPVHASLDFAQAAANIVVHRLGTSVCSAEDLAGYLDGGTDPLVPEAELLARIASARAAGKRIVLTNGCFDVLHRGHTNYLRQAKERGDILVVALNSDESARRLKGPGRPINTAADRAGVLAALDCIDYVTVFGTDTPIPLIEQLHPDVYAKGGDYTPEMLQETAAVEAYGGEIAILDYVADHSTSDVLRRIRSSV
ncbi:D-glycero-beta-D-manno-heptose 1-phosphate adenylyltransferase [Saxibacter everestensis]|uniref:Bifunctional protein HldE n=1 Tax=Saxibacter everestensis TaxID=2909229 RepID=A0ABY8QV83_9MICO|nr:D-glycero-beta-D-manno-heptose 1-phosphate adenylyltransferase [Brevibacteriaceae bacterium ZFBP1038]